MKSLKRNIILVITLALTILLGSFGGVLFAKQKTKVFADENVELIVEKVNLYQNDDKQYAIYYEYFLTDKQIGSGGTGTTYSVDLFSYSATTDTYTKVENFVGNAREAGLYERSLIRKKIDFNDLLNNNNPFLTGDFRKATAYEGALIQENKEDDNIFLIKNNELENESITTEKRDAGNQPILDNNNPETEIYYYTLKEYMLVMFKPAQNSKLVTLITNAKLSGSINTSLGSSFNISPLEKTTAQEGITAYCQFFDLNNTWVLDNTQVGGLGQKLNEFDAQGKYTFTFTYNVRSSGAVSDRRTASTSFYMLNEKYYLNSNSDAFTYIKTNDKTFVSGKDYFVKNENGEFKPVEDTSIDEISQTYELDESITNAVIYESAADSTFDLQNASKYYFINQNGDFEQISQPDATNVLNHCYERIDAQNVNIYTKTTDTEFDTNKSYYVLDNGEFELVDTENFNHYLIEDCYELQTIESGTIYSKTKDTIFNAEKTYYFSSYDLTELAYKKVGDDYVKMTSEDDYNQDLYYFDENIYFTELLENLYEEVNQPSSRVYRKTSDTSYIDGKTYYKLNDNLLDYIYEKIDDNHYIKTPDIVIEPNTAYYVFYDGELETADTTTEDITKCYEKESLTNNNYTQPKLVDTEKIDYSYFTEEDYSSEQNYFNFNNFNTVDYDNNKTTLDDKNHLKYPKIVYDATRYNLTYTKTMYGITTTVTTYLDYSNNEVKLVLNYDDGTTRYITTQPSTEDTSCIKKENSGYYTQYIVTLEFNEVGKYVLSFDFVLKNVVLTQNNPDVKFVKTENWDMLHTDELTIFGYQVMHSVYGTNPIVTDSELKNVANNLFADVTNIKNNKIDISNKSTISLESEEITYPVSTFGAVPKTNQAPVSFKYFATLDGSIDNTYYYKYIKNGNCFELVQENGQAKKFSLTSNTKFTESGLYIVRLSYTYQDYKYYDAELGEFTDDKDLKYQIFIFEIANDEPKVEFYKYEEVNKQEITFDKTKMYEYVANSYKLTTDNNYSNEKTYYLRQELKTGGFTKYTTEINWSSSLTNPFDIKPKVTISAQGFENNATASQLSFEETDILQGKVFVEQSKLYTINVEYGPCTYVYDTTQNKYRYVYSASVSSMFTIDKESIGEGENIIEFYEENFEKLTKLTQSNRLTNKNFAVVFGTVKNGNSTEIETTGLKKSGAKISVNYSFLPITPNNYDIEKPLDENNLYVPNGSAILSKNNNVAYNQSIVNNTSWSSSNSLSNDGIYIFTFVDEAGNSTKKYIIKDSTAPLLMQYLEDVESVNHYSSIPSTISNEENMVNIDATIIWGKYKAIKLDFDSVEELKAELTNSNIGYSIQKFNDSNYLIIDINTNFSSTSSGIYERIPTNATTIYYLNDENRYASPNLDYLEVASNPCNCLTIKTVDEFGNLILDNEQYFKIRIYDKIGNYFEGKVEVTFDKSMLTAEVSGMPSKNIQLINSNSSFDTVGETISTRLHKKEASNKKTLSFSWIDGSDEYTVTSVDCYFYALTFEQYVNNDPSVLNLNYPYSANATQYFDLTKNTTHEVAKSNLNNDRNATVVKTKTPAINVVQDSRYDGELATVPGMYRVTRIYNNDPSTENEYLFYIDRNNIVSYSDNSQNYIGDDITITLGNVTENDKYIFKGKNFLEDMIYDYIFITNKQPANLEVPSYKYYSTDLDERFFDENGNALAKNLNTTRLYLSVSNIEIVENNYSFKGDINNDSVIIYKVKIRDDVGGKYNNEMQFNVAVNLYPPKAEFIDNDKPNIFLKEGTSNYISKNNTNVSLVWTVDETNINASINEKDITIRQILPNNTSKVLYDNSYDNSIVTVSGNKRYINFSQFYNQINNVNCRVEITLKYLTQTPVVYGNKHLSSKKIIYFDFEKPQTNFNYLFENDKYLKTLNITKEQFENYESPISFDNYTFVVSSDFRLKIPARSTFWQNGLDSSVTTNPNDNDSSVWYRKYQKFLKDDSIYQQSIVEGDIRYNDSSMAPNRLMFNAYTGTNNPDSSGTIDTYTKIPTAINEQEFIAEEGYYYEIIERDCANNYRIYTIYVMPSDETNSTKIEYKKTEESEFGQIDYVFINSNQTTYEINNKKIEISKLHNLGDWFVINLIDGASGQVLINNLKVAPIDISGHVKLNTALSQINNSIIDENGVGKHFILKIINSNFDGLFMHYRTPGQVYELDANITSSGVFTVNIDPNRYAGTYLTKLEVFEIDALTTQQVQVLVDNTGKNIQKDYKSSDNVMTYKFTFSDTKVRNMWFKFDDNFGVSYVENYILGIAQTPFEEMIKFSDIYVQNYNYTPKTISGISNFTKSTEYYTASNLTFEFQSKIYSIISIDYIDEYNTLQHYGNIDNIRDGLNRVEIFKLDGLPVMEDLQVFITFMDTSNKFYQYSLHNYKKVSELTFKDSSNFEHDFDIETTISRPIYLLYNEYDTNSSYPIKTVVTGTRTYVNSNNVTTVENLGELNPEYVFNKIGKYVITARNELGVEKVYKFEYIESDAVYYSVKANVDGKLVTIYPSEVPYDAEQMIDHYVSIYDANVYVNQDKNLKVEEESVSYNGKTKIYVISPINDSFSYKTKRIAITKVEKTSNLLNGLATITQIKDIEGEEVTGNPESISFKYIKSNAKKVIFTIPAWNTNEYEIRSNLLKVKIVYNNKDLGYATLSTNDDTSYIELTVAGTYRLYVYDLAGNQHSFGGTPYFELSLINNFIYTLNGKKGIYNSIYNGAVEFGIEQAGNFVNDNNGNSYTITATLNGSPYTYTYLNGKYVFNNYGTYIVTLKGYLNKDINGNFIDEVITEIKFTILNSNEARLMHEYIGLNGYEITKIIKNNEDITELVKERLNSATLTKFMISGLKDGIGGSGKYDITVTAFLDKIVGESEFTYSVWINNDNELLIIPSIKEGDSTTQNITLKLNLYQIYSKVGECNLKINGNTIIAINGTSATNNTITTITLTENTRYNVTLETLDGNTITSFVVTKTEPLNTIAIIIIVVASVVVAGLALTFILLRKKMRVR